MNELELTLAIHDYDHTRDLIEGRVETPGLRLRAILLPPPEINARFSLYREWHVSEFGLGKYLAMRAAGDDGAVAIPVFPARAFRQSAIYVAAESDLHTPEQLAGRRVGIPEWAQTAVVYARGFLVHYYGIPLSAIDWHQAGVTRAGRTEKVGVRLPEGVRLTRHPDRTLEDLLLAGDVDAIITAQPPPGFAAGDSRIRRLLQDPQSAEEAYYRATGIFPIMHAVVIRRDVHEAHPWVALNLVEAFETAKRRSYQRLFDGMAWRYPLPWISSAAERVRSVFGLDFYPYGIEANRTTLEALLDYAFEQGVTARRLRVEELFAPTTLRSLRL